MRIVDQNIVVAGERLAPSAFTRLIKSHPKGIAIALSLEAEAKEILRGDLSDQQLRGFIRHVCEWGNYPRTADRVLHGNSWPEIRRRFGYAIDALAQSEPDITFALREIRSIRYLGVSFATKHLRLLRPDVCPVLDSTLSEKLGYPLNVAGYRRFSDACLRIGKYLEEVRVSNPVERDGGAWYAADVEMALFVYVKERFF